MQTLRDERPTIDIEQIAGRRYQDYAREALAAGLAPVGKAAAFVGSLHNQELMIAQLANAFMVQLFDLSALAPGDFKTKVLAFQDEVKTVLTHYLREAARTENLRIGLVLESAGHSASASLVRTTQV